MSSPDPNNPLQFSSDPKSAAIQKAMLKLLATPPESILNMFERLQIPWQRIAPGQQIAIKDDNVFVVKWSDLVVGETRNQKEGPFIKKLLGEIKSAQMNAEEFQQISIVEDTDGS